MKNSFAMVRILLMGMQSFERYYNYIDKGRVVADLVNAGVLHIGDDNRLLANWPFEATSETRFRRYLKLSGSQKKNGVKKISLRSSRVMPLVCWQWNRRATDKLYLD